MDDDWLKVIPSMGRLSNQERRLIDDNQKDKEDHKVDERMKVDDTMKQLQ